VFDFIFDNIYILIPIAFIIVFNILNKRQKRQAEAQGREDSSAGSGEDDDEAGRYFKAPVQPAPVQPKKKPKAETQGLTEQSPVEVRRPVSSQAKKAPANLESGGRAGSFPQNLEYLPPLKRALVLSEILGPPKADI
jgi:hypothetical protein